MFVPKLYRSEDRDLMKKIMSENAFAVLISSKEKIRATHAMMLWNEENEEKSFVETHISRANPQAKTVKNGDEVLCDFLGAHTYISSSWYDHTNVSTWNYEAVQIYGTVELMNGSELITHLEKLTYKFEKNQKCPMLVEKMGLDFVQREMKGAFGMKIYPTEIFIKQKLSQNRKDYDFQNIITELRAWGSPNDRAIADEMEKIRP